MPTHTYLSVSGRVRMFEFGHEVLPAAFSWYHGGACLSRDETRFAALSKDGHVNLCHWPSMVVYATIPTCAVFLQTFTCHDTLLVRDAQQCVAEYSWGGSKLRTWLARATAVVPSSTGDLAFFDRERNEVRVFSAADHKWCATVALPEPKWNLVGLSNRPRRLFLTNTRGTKLMTVDAKTGSVSKVVKLPPALLPSKLASPFYGEEVLIVAESKFNDSKLSCTVVSPSRGSACRVHVSESMSRLFPLNQRVCAGVLLPAGNVQLMYLNVSVAPAVKTMRAFAHRFKPSTIQCVVGFLKPIPIQSVS